MGCCMAVGEVVTGAAGVGAGVMQEQESQQWGLM